MKLTKFSLHLVCATLRKGSDLQYTAQLDVFGSQYMS